VTVHQDKFSPSVVQTDIPARLDRLPWGRFHTLVVVALGITWILDGLEVTLAGTISGALKDSSSLGFSNADVGFASSAYLAGAVCGALFFGWLTDRLGRKKLFFITLIVYLIATACTAFAWDLASFALFRFLTGAGIGGEYAAINSTIQELIPARVRGRIDLMINGSFWIGAALASVAAIILLDPNVLEPDLGWRAAFLIGAALSAIILFLRSFLPESPRWLVTHGRKPEAEMVVASIETRVLGQSRLSEALPQIRLRPRSHTSFADIITTLLVLYRQRAVVGLVLMSAQAFFYNAIFFTYALVLTDFYGIKSDQVGWYILPLAAGNFLGPAILGPLFDSLGRRIMISFTYIASGLLLILTGYLFVMDMMTASQQTFAWTIVFFFASAAASSAYLTVSETFPLEIRAMTIALFYALGTAIGGIGGPWLFGVLIDTGSRSSVYAGYLLGAALMIVAGLVALRYCVGAERRSLEAVARPLACVD
jgi:MFS family permease